jgi:signal transduction histidine kinase
VRIPAALLPAGIAFGLAVEVAFYSPALGPALTVADFTVGCMLLVCGTVAWQRREESRVGPLMGLAGLTWFLGNIGQPLLYLHRGPLVHLHLSYPTGRLPTRLAAAVVAIAYVDAVVEPLAANDVLTLALSALIALSALQVFRRTSGPARKAGGPALGAALAFAGVLALGALNRLLGWDADRAVLWTYDAVIASIAVVLLRDLLRGRWTDAVVTGLVVDLGDQHSGTLRAKLARALGDPTLVVGYRLPEADGFVDDAGRPVELPSAGSGRVVTPLADGDEQVAVLVHDEALLADRHLVESVAAAARVAVANARLQAEAQARAGELVASRRRIVQTADEQRRRLEEELRLGAEQRLENVQALLEDSRSEVTGGDADAIATLEHELDETRRELREFAHGVHPGALTEGGLMPALARLAARSPIPVAVTGTVTRLPAPVEAALYFVCSEALTNAAKHSSASSISVKVGQERKRVVVSIVDDGVGGADPSKGSGLRGLADRIEALGGRLAVESAGGSGTRIDADLPATASPRASAD